MVKKSIIRTDRIRILLRETEESVDIIREHLTDTTSLDSFIALGIIKDGIYKRLEYCLQNIFDICAIINRDLRLGVPQSDDDTIQHLINAGVVDESMGEKLHDMKGFRNILVHQYGRINDDIAFAILGTELLDIISFCEHIDRYIRETNF